MSTPDYSTYTNGIQPGSNDLANLGELIAQMQEAEEAVREAEIELKHRQEVLRTLAEHDIPELMMACGIETFETTDGIKVSIKKDVRASIPVAMREKAYAWLEEHGYSGLIKREVRVGFRRDQGEEAQALLDELGAKHGNVMERQEIHPSTLKAFLKEQLEAGENIPMEMFGAFELRRAKIKKRS